MRADNMPGGRRGGAGSRPATRLIARATRLSPSTLALASVTLSASDVVYRRVGYSVIPGGALDEMAHLMTALLVLWALGPRVCKRFMLPALIASVAIDLDHVPAQLGVSGLTNGTPRPYTHSLLAVALVLIVGVVWRRRRDVMLGVALGLMLHFARDLAESNAGLSLLWPWSDHASTISHGAYLAAFGAAVLLSALRLVAARGGFGGLSTTAYRRT
jgi:inner membrane protein